MSVLNVVFLPACLSGDAAAALEAWVSGGALNARLLWSGLFTMASSSLWPPSSTAGAAAAEHRGSIAECDAHAGV